jgi:SAM-dependent methyltransferase
MVVKVQLDSLRMTGRTVGRLSATGTVGALFGTFATGFVLLAAFPTPPIVVALGAMLVASGVALWTWLPRHDGASQPPVIAGAVALAALGLYMGTPCQQETAYFCASVIEDTDVRGGRLLVLDTLRHSYVDLDDPTHLEFDYARVVVDVIDAHHTQGRALDVLHIGGGGFTLPRYLDATRPGTNSLVLELDPELIALARDELGLITSPQLQVRAGDARLGIQQVPSDSRDVVVGDAFGGLAVPWHLTTTEFLAEVQRVLRPGGIYVLNLIDHPPSAFARAETATLAAAFPETAVVASSDRLNGGEGGNFVLAGGPLDIVRIQERLRARDAVETVIAGAQRERFTGDAAILTDAYAPVDQLLEPRPAAG